MEHPATVLLPTAYLPPVQYMSHLAVSAEVYLEGGETFQKGGFRRRCELAGANGPLLLSIPLEKGKHNQLPIREVRIANRSDWGREHWQTIRSAYGRAPFFDFYAGELEALVRSRPTHLWDHNLACLQWLIGQLGLDTELRTTESYAADPGPQRLDLRNRINRRASIKEGDPWFEPQPYAQLFRERHGFLPNLSILDLLFCTGPQAAWHLQSSIRKPKTDPD